MSDVQIETKEIGGVNYVLKLIPTMSALSIVHKLETSGPTPEVIFEVVNKGANIGSVTIDQKKFDKQFAGKLKELMELFMAILQYNNMAPEVEGNDQGSNE